MRPGPSPTLRALRWLHLYGGLALAIPLLLLALSGTLLVFKHDYWQWRHPGLADDPPARDPAGHAAIIERIADRLDPAITLVKLPHAGMSAYQLWLADGSEALVDAESLRVLDRWHWWQRPTGWLVELHTHLLAGEAGRAAIGWIGIAVFALLVAGAVVWWPLRRLFRWRALTPADCSRPRMLMFHRNLGIIVAPLCLVLIAGGVGTAFFQPSRIALNALFGDSAGAPLAAKPDPGGSSGPALPLASLLAQAQAALPAGRIVFVYPDITNQGILTVRLKVPGEAHPNGLSFVHIDRATGAALRVVDASSAPPGDRIANWMYPLHSGKWGAPLWPIVVALNGMLLGMLVIAGFLAWRRRPAPGANPGR